MKKIILSIASILIASSLFAQEDEQSRSEITINLGGGLSGLQYQMESGGKNTLGLGGSFGLGYTFFINNQFGIGTGVEANFYQSEYSNDHLTGSYEVADLQNPSEYLQLKYDYQNAYKEKQSALFVQVPLMFQFQTAGYHKFYVAAGGRVGFPINTKFDTDPSSLTVSGLYSHEQVEYKDLPNHGFTSYNSPQTEGKLSLKTAYMASLELGMKWAISDNFKLYTGLYGDYGLNDIQQTKNAGTATYQQDYKGTDPNGFLSFNNSITSTSAVKKIIPMTAGLKLRFTFGLGEKVGSASKAAREQEAYYRAAAEEAQRRADAARLAEKPDTVLVEVGYYYDPVTGTMVKIGDEGIPDRQRPAVSSEDMQILLEPIWGFEVGKWDLKSEMTRILDRKVPILKKYWYLGIVLTGNTCDLGGELLNDRLGYERAQSVKDYFVKNGLISTRFSTRSNGKDKPVVPNDSETHRKRNRRVELSIKK